MELEIIAFFVLSDELMKSIELFLFNFHPHPYLLPSREKEI